MHVTQSPQVAAVSRELIWDFIRADIESSVIVDAALVRIGVWDILSLRKQGMINPKLVQLAHEADGVCPTGHSNQFAWLE